MSDTIYAIGDIHGQYDMLTQALDHIEQDGGRDAKVVFLGDLVDRGPNSKLVVQHLIDGIAAGKDWTVLRGNHDQLFANFLEPEPKIEMRLMIGMDWLDDRLGGQTTLASYGVEITDQSRHWEVHEQARALVPRSHTDFIKSLPMTHIDGGYLFVHAGIRPDVPLDQQEQEDLYWIREPFLSYPDPHPYIIVHGHTAIKAATHYGNRINIDTGAGYGRKLTVLGIEGQDTWLLDETGRHPF